MHLAQLFGALVLGALSSASATANAQSPANDFVKICIENLPSQGDAVNIAEQRNFEEIPVGLDSSFDKMILEPPHWRIYGSASDDGDGELLLLYLAETLVPDEDQATIGTKKAALCQLGMQGGSAEAFITELTKLLRLGKPSLDIMNSGKRERMWTTFVSYQLSTIILKDTSGSDDEGFVVRLIVPLVER